MKNILFVILMLGLVVSPVYAERPENGTVKETDGAGRLKAILKYKNGHLIRKRVYAENGQMILDVVYRDEAAVAIKSYYLNGQLKSVWSKKSREARFFYPTGQHKITVPVRDPSRLEQ